MTHCLLRKTKLRIIFLSAKSFLTLSPRQFARFQLTLPTDMKKLFVAAIISLLPATVLADTADDRYTSYINRYSKMAVEQQQAYGIPASITLAQGLLESAAGHSTLASKGNNHFGIKCHKEWQGDFMLRDDDAPDECFRVYSNAAESFRDHSIFLSRPRYKSLYDNDITDYAAWARGLSKCGYATDPNYAARLIAIIERYALYTYDTEAGRHAEETVDFIRRQLLKTHPVRRSRGLHYVIANPGDTYSALAKEFHIDKKKLLRYNDAQADNIREWQEVYLEPKLDCGPDGVASATIGEDETIHSIAQRYGIQLKALQALNPGAKDRPGQRLRLR